MFSTFQIKVNCTITISMDMMGITTGISLSILSSWIAPNPAAAIKRGMCVDHIVEKSPQLNFSGNFS